MFILKHAGCIHTNFVYVQKRIGDHSNRINNNNHNINKDNDKVQKVKIAPLIYLFSYARHIFFSLNPLFLSHCRVILFAALYHFDRAS